MRSTDLDTLLSKVGPVGQDTPGEYEEAPRGLNPTPVPVRKRVSKSIIFGAVAILVIGSVAAGYYLRPNSASNSAQNGEQTIPTASGTVVSAATDPKPIASVETAPPTLKTGSAALEPKPVAAKSQGSTTTDIGIASGLEASKTAPVPLAELPSESEINAADNARMVKANADKTGVAVVVEQPVPAAKSPGVSTKGEAIPAPPKLLPTAVAKASPAATVPEAPRAVPETPTAVETATVIEQLAAPKIAVPASPRPKPVKPKIAAPSAGAPAQTVTPPKAPKPVRLAARPPAAPQKAAAAAVTKSSYFVQFVSVKSRRAADREWERLRKRYATLLGPFEPSIQKATVAKRGTFYRLRAAGFETRDQARTLCAKMKAAGQGCLVVRR